MLVFFLLDLFFDLEYADDMFFRNVGRLFNGLHDAISHRAEFIFLHKDYLTLSLVDLITRRYIPELFIITAAITSNPARCRMSENPSPFVAMMG